MTAAKHVLGLYEVGQLLGGLTPDTVTRYMRASRADGRYAKHPFPTPSGRVGNSPYWVLERSDEIVNWGATRPGRGSGGGRPGRRV